MDFQNNGPETANEEDIFVPSEDVQEHLVVVGNGMAGCRAVEELLARDKPGQGGDAIASPSSAQSLM